MLWEDRNGACLFSFSLALDNWYRQGKERKRDSFFSALKAPAVVLAHVLCIYTLTCSVLEGGNVDMISLSMFWFSVHSSNSCRGKIKWWEAGIHCWLWTDHGIFPPVNFFVTQLESISFSNCHALSTSLAEYIMYQSGLLMCFCFERAWLLATIIYEIEPLLKARIFTEICG